MVLIHHYRFIFNYNFRTLNNMYLQPVVKESYNLISFKGREKDFSLVVYYLVAIEHKNEEYY